MRDAVRRRTFPAPAATLLGVVLLNAAPLPTVIESNHAPPSLRPRGVYALDFLSAEGHSYIVAVSSAGRNVVWSAVPPGCDYAGTWDRITRQLDEVDPVDVLHGARPMRLMRGTAVTSPTAVLLACRRPPRPASH